MPNKTTQPIKDRKKIEEIFTYLKGQSNRNYMLAKIQFNTARRVSDIVCLKLSDFMNKNGTFKMQLIINEKKTGKQSIVLVNSALKLALKDYARTEQLHYSDYLFKSRKGQNMPITTTQVHRIFADVANALKIESFGTHSLRKTWGYFCYKETKNIALIMQVYNHSSQKETLKYIGITQEDIDGIFGKINF